jgi:hypothetical protein
MTRRNVFTPALSGVCGAFWTDELQVATCATRPFAQRFAKSQADFFKDYK